MKWLPRFLKRALLFSGLTLVFLATVAGLPNRASEFCSTKAYGYPLPWTVDHCPCGGGKFEFSMTNAALNLGLVAFAGLVGAGLVTAIRPTPLKEE